MVSILVIKNYNETKNELELIKTRITLLEKNYEYFIDEKKALLEQEKNLKSCVTEMEQTLKKLSGIEYQLFYEIIVNQLNVTKAIDKVSVSVDKDPSTLWKYYYPKIKPEIMKFASENQVQQSIQ